MHHSRDRAAGVEHERHLRHGGGGCRREVPQRLKDFLVAHARLGIAGARR
jgi:hypothetical protein